MKYKLRRFLIVAMLMILCFPVITAKAVNEKPRVILSSYQVTKEAIAPGEQATISLTFKNTDTAVSAKSILITLTSSDKKMKPIYGESNQIYISEIGPSAELTKEVRLDSDKEIETTTTELILDMVYTDGTGANYVNTTKISIPVEHPKVLSVIGYTVPETTRVGTKTSFSATYENTGVENLYNIKMNLNGSSLEAPVKINLNSLTAGTKSYAEAYLEFSTLGEQEIDVNFTYEDEEGNVYVTLNETFKINVTEDEIPGTQDSQSQVINSTSSDQIWQMGLIIAIFILFVIAIASYKKNKD